MAPGSGAPTGQVSQVAEEPPQACDSGSPAQRSGFGVDDLCVSSAPVCLLGVGQPGGRAAGSRSFWVSFSQGFCITRSAAVLEGAWGHPSPAISPGSSSLGFRPHKEGVPGFRSPGCVSRSTPGAQGQGRLHKDKGVSFQHKQLFLFKM